MRTNEMIIRQLYSNVTNRDERSFVCPNVYLFLVRYFLYSLSLFFNLFVFCTFILCVYGRTNVTNIILLTCKHIRPYPSHMSYLYNKTKCKIIHFHYGYYWKSTYYCLVNIYISLFFHTHTHTHTLSKKYTHSSKKYCETENEYSIMYTHTLTNQRWYVNLYLIIFCIKHN